MLGLAELKGRIQLTNTTVECPVKGCGEAVERQRGIFRREEKFRCARHNIYISPSTFEYQSELDNILWTEKADLDLLDQVKAAKRESRIARDNSEDAVTWNVFRFLERKNLIPGFLSTFTGSSVGSAEVIYWSHSRSERGPWSHLMEARKTFETTPRRGSEPDVIIRTDRELFFVEAKLTAGNNTVPHSKSPDAQRKYESGGGSWYRHAFKSNFETIAVTEKKYELMRFWLIGSWIAKRLSLDFCLVNLVPSKREIDIERIFKKHIKENRDRMFVRAAWEHVYEHILKSQVSSRARDIILRYIRNKSLGYDEHGKLIRAFSIN